MNVIKVCGPSHAEGIADVQGSKNAALPMMAAAVITGEKTVLENCPDISDIRVTADILRTLGCSVSFENNTLTVDSSGEVTNYIPMHLTCKLRSSFLLCGALLARCKNVSLAYPGGCRIGCRPVDIHLNAFEKLGAKITKTDEGVSLAMDKFTPCDVYFPFPSVGATENVMIYAAAMPGTVRIIGAACEPEIADLQKMLNSAGGNVSGAGTPVVTIRGTKAFSGTRCSVMPDRIAAATLMTLPAMTGGEIILRNACARHVSPYIAFLRKHGVSVCSCSDGLAVSAKKRLNADAVIQTAPYPGFATDMQSLCMAVSSLGKGVCVIKENVFENRFLMSGALTAMGADIKVRGRCASIRGVRSLNCANVSASDLRSGAALIAAMSAAHGESSLSGIEYIDRGYENIVRDFSALGVDIERIEKN